MKEYILSFNCILHLDIYYYHFSIDQLITHIVKFF